MTCRCGHTGEGPHPCHGDAYRCRRPAVARFFRPRAVGLAGTFAKREASQTFACDACWQAFLATRPVTEVRA